MDNSSNDSGSDAVIGFLFFILLFLAFIYALYWIYNDSKRNQVSVFDKPYSPDDSKIWFFICFMCCVLGAPYYFYRRAAVLAPKTTQSPTSSEAQLREL